MVFKILTKLEDPEHPLLGPTLWGLQTWGMWQPNKGLTRYLYNVIHVMAIIFVLTQYIELWYIRLNLEMALRNLSVTMLSTVCVVKAGTFVLWQKHWKNVFENVSWLEKKQQSKHDATTNKIIMKYTGYSRTVTYFYWCLVTATVFTVILAPLVIYLSSFQRRSEIRNGTVAYPEIMSSWVPFDKSRGFGYWVLVVVHTLICFYGGGIVANYDSNAVVLMSFFAGQLELLKSNCARLFGDGREYISYKHAIKRIRDCHQHHVQLIKYSKVLNSLLSPVMFLYVIICSLMFCANAVQLTTEGTTGMQQVWIAEYLVALVAQLFLYCWHSNKVLYMIWLVHFSLGKSELRFNRGMQLGFLLEFNPDVIYKSLKVDEGVYASAWWSQEVRVRRCVALLGGQLNKSVVFTAGPFTELTVATFVGILKGSYSYYTLLSKKED